MKYIKFWVVLCSVFVFKNVVYAQQDSIPENHIAPAPLFRDPVTEAPE